MNTPGRKRLLPEYRDALYDAVRVGGFRNRLPEDEAQAVPKLFLRAQRFLRALRRGKLLEEYKFDEQWLAKNKFDFSIFAEEDIPGLVHRATRRYRMMREEGYWPPVKNTLTRDIDVFFFHPQTRKSWFLHCVFNPAKPLEGAPAGGKSGAGASLSEEERIVILKHMRPGWVEVCYLGKASDLLAWYKGNQESLRVYNYYVKDSTQIWKEHFSTFEYLLSTIDEYAKTWDGWTLGNYGRGNKTWALFLGWCREKYKVELEPTPEGLREAQEIQKKEAARSKALEAEFGRERADLDEKAERIRRQFLGEQE